MQAVKGAPSREHWKEAIPEPPGSVAEKAKVAPVALVSAAGPESIVVSGAVESRVTLLVAEAVLPAASVRQRRSWLAPSASAEAAIVELCPAGWV